MRCSVVEIIMSRSVPYAMVVLLVDALQRVLVPLNCGMYEPVPHQKRALSNATPCVFVNAGGWKREYDESASPNNLSLIGRADLLDTLRAVFSLSTVLLWQW